MNLEHQLQLINERLFNNLFPTSPTELYVPCTYFLNIGGKRLRPLLCFVGNNLFSSEHPKTMDLALAIELFHNFTLMHDDIMDLSPLRRNQKTVHTKFNQNTAILSGDVMLIKAYKLLENIPIEYLPKIFVILNETATKVCEGQQLDLNFEQKMHLSLNDYLEMVTLKTAVLFAASLQMGAVLGGACNESLDALYEFGINLGIAFQIQDDYLDCYGTQNQLGKEIGNDIKHNKKTILSTYLLDHGSLDIIEKFQQIIYEDPVDKVEKILNIYKSLNLKKKVIEMQTIYIQKGLNYLNMIKDCNPVYKNWLVDLAENLQNRTR
ncbi:MAG: polyprenyl synthetase family protein [Alphaproteobacteria bacterium]|nr:polyprenyl synthetase family protein [Alphaproteobacteria bacterium]